MFRGRLVDCHEVPDRLRYVLDELQRRPVGQLMTPDAALDVHAAMARVHAPDYLAFLARAWDDWVAQDPANAERDALPSVWPMVVPLGLDTLEGDPISGFNLRSGDYLQLGRAIAQLGLPTVLTFEGGYAVEEVGMNTVNVLEGLSG